MRACVSNYVGALLVAIATASAACTTANDISPTAPAVVDEPMMTAEPVAARPEFPGRHVCPKLPNFGIRVGITFRGRHDMVAHRLRFQFKDHFGNFALPIAISGARSPATNLGVLPMPSQGAVTMPSASPIPMPTSLPIEGILVSAGVSQSFNFFLEFGCGLNSQGILSARADLYDRKGTALTSEVTIRVD